MLSKHDVNHWNQEAVVSVADFIPKDLLIRKIDPTIDFSFIYLLVQDFYSPVGRRSTDPLVLIKMTFIQYVFDIRSIRQTIHEIETNAAYRWFLGLSSQDKVPHFSTFSKNYERHFKETDLFEQIFYRILREVANLNHKRKFEKKMVRKEILSY